MQPPHTIETQRMERAFRKDAGIVSGDCIISGGQTLPHFAGQPEKKREEQKLYRNRFKIVLCFGGMRGART